MGNRIGFQWLHFPTLILNEDVVTTFCIQLLCLLAILGCPKWNRLEVQHPSIISLLLFQQHLDSSLTLGMGHPSPSSEEKSAADLAAKLLLLDELVSLENDVIETKKKRSFSGFGAPLDRLSAGSVDLKSKPRKVVEVPKRRFGIPLDRIGANRLNNSRGLSTHLEAMSKTSRIAGDAPVIPKLVSLSKKSKNCTSPVSTSNKL
ncbi:osteocrin [Sceloporus undulatus]|uniref:osteocrin n=1 Tax=Sceloporus undulatus TaxID=8520 RepID=UPI001C4C84CB|nr:osteocrin [Sceloporus undulatus]